MAIGLLDDADCGDLASVLGISLVARLQVARGGPDQKANHKGGNQGLSTELRLLPRRARTNRTTRRVDNMVHEHRFRVIVH